MEPLDPPVAVASAPSVQARILPANLLFLISLVLVITLGSALPALLIASATGSLAPALRYDVEQPHTLVRYRDSGTEWVLAR